MRRAASSGTARTASARRTARADGAARPRCRSPYSPGTPRSSTRARRRAGRSRPRSPRRRTRSPAGAWPAASDWSEDVRVGQRQDVERDARREVALDDPHAGERPERGRARGCRAARAPADEQPPCRASQPRFVLSMRPAIMGAPLIARRACAPEVACGSGMSAPPAFFFSSQPSR